MARLFRFCVALAAVLVLVDFAVAADPPQHSPAPAPHSGAPSPSRRLSPAHPPTAPSPSPYHGSPPAPPQAPESSPSPSPGSSPAQTPSPSNIGDVQHRDTGKAEAESSSGGLKGGQKAGIALGVIACVAVVGFGCLLYKKRRENIERSRYSYAARREIL